MPQSLSAVYIHLIFSTKERYPYLRDQTLQTDLHTYLGRVSKELDCPPIRVGGVRKSCTPTNQVRPNNYASRVGKRTKASFKYLAKDRGWTLGVSVAGRLRGFFS